MQSAVKLLTTVVKEIGLTGLLVVTVIAIFLFYGTEKQKQLFIDKFILLKGDVSYCVVVILFLMATIVLGGTYQFKSLKAREAENNRIGREKSKLQEQFLDKELRSSENSEE